MISQNFMKDGSEWKFAICKKPLRSWSRVEVHCVRLRVYTVTDKDLRLTQCSNLELEAAYCFAAKKGHQLGYSSLYLIRQWLGNY